jgi:tRNA/tmRNA/rRNA uracil-C5-methylase (TrmA/RlmC/RlmD family)
MTSDKRVEIKVGDRAIVGIEKVAHGGHFIARHGGAVLFVRHAIPGEEVEIEVTSVGATFHRADVVRVITPSPDRTSPPCIYANRTGCGGCDFQHISLSRQRSLKGDVISEQFARIAKMEIKVEVEEVGPALGWRTRCNAVTTRNGALGFYKSRSHNIVPVESCRILAPELGFDELARKKWKSDQRVEISISNTGERTVAVAQSKMEGPASVIEGDDISHYTIAGRTLEVSQKSFWQSHKDAPQILSSAVLSFADLKIGESVLDLYGGVGLFTASMVGLVGSTGRIDLVEGSKSATADAAQNFSGDESVHIHTGDVAKILPRFSGADVIVLDPPREGAGREVVQSMVALSPRAIIYVACDPAALARDTGYLQSHGYTLQKMRAFDLFPMTHHIESVALFEADKVS